MPTKSLEKKRRSDNPTRLLYENRHKFIEPTKPGPYLSPNVIHRRIFWQRIFLAQRFVDTYCENFDRAIDFGTNQGVIIPYLVSRFDSVASIDLPKVREKANQKVNLPNMLNYFELPVTKLEYIDIDPSDQVLDVFDDNSADCIIATNVLEHIPDVATLAFNLRRILKPDGVMIVSVPLEHVLYRIGVFLNHILFRTGLDRDYHINTSEDIDKVLKANFKVLKTQVLWGFFRFYALGGPGCRC